MPEDVRNNMNIRGINQQIVLNYLRKNKISSRIDIYNETQLSKSTITRVIKNLIDEGLVREIGSSEAEFGRKPIKIELISVSKYCIGINISKNNIYGVLIDLNMKIVKKTEYCLKDITNQADFLEYISNTIKELVSILEADKAKIMGVGVSVPGLVDYDKGFILKLDTVNPIKNIAIKQFIENTMGYITMVDNNANTRVLGEYWYGCGYEYSQEVQNLIYIVCNERVRAGIICEGNLLRGQKNMAGEIGNFVIKLDGKEYCYLEDFCSVNKIEEITGIPYSEVCTQALDGNKRYLNLLNEAVEALSIALTNIILALNPELVILSGELLEFYPQLFTLTVDKIKRYLKRDFIKPDFIFRKVENPILAIGAATLIFKQLFI